MRIDRQVKELSRIFKGLERAYGTYIVTEEEENGKRVGPRKTVIEPVTAELWKKHVTGKSGLGIVPINDDNKCFFGAIDIDIYDGFNHKELIDRIKNFDLPLTVFRTKSGGAHVFAFVSEPIPARLMRDKLTNWSSALGYGDSEIFPKQNEILAERGDVGGWINIPYFNSKKTDRYAFDEDGDELSVDDFISLAQTIRLTKKEFEAADVKIKTGIEDGPPCLECLITYGITKGSRNDGLFNLGVYLKKSRPDTWENDIQDMNVEYFDPPLSHSEIDNIIKSLDKKDYFYSCNRNPIKAYCNQTVCKTREFGVGNESSMPQLTGLTKYNTQPPIWFLDVEDGGRLELTTDDIQNQSRFQKRCIDVLNIFPPTIKRPAWISLVRDLLADVTIIDAPIDASPIGQLLETIERFCTGRSQARDKSEVLLDKPWTENNRHYFKVSALMGYLDKHGIREFKVNQITSILKDRGGKHEFFNLKGKGVNVWSIPEFSQQSENFDTPDMGPEEPF